MKKKLTQEEVDVLYSKPYLSVKEVCHLTDLSRQTIYSATKTGRLTYKKMMNGTARFDVAPVKGYVIRKRRLLLEHLQKLLLPSTS